MTVDVDGERRPARMIRAGAAAAVLALATGCAAWFEEPMDPDAEPAPDAEVTDEELEPTEAAAIDDAEAEEERLEEAEARGLDPEDPLDAAVLEDEDSPLATRRVHFAFDSSEIRDEDMPILEAHGEFLAEHPERTMTIEGHTDERGSREYNLALGERRAESVARRLRASGADAEQLEIVSYGEENPLVPESNEEAWAENRRAELLYER